MIRSARRRKRYRRSPEQIKKQIDTPVFFQDERLSTFAAEGKMIDMDLTRKGKKRRIDALAAAEILQAFLDSKKAT